MRPYETAADKKEKEGAFLVGCLFLFVFFVPLLIGINLHCHQACEATETTCLVNKYIVSKFDSNIDISQIVWSVTPAQDMYGESSNKTVFLEDKDFGWYKLDKQNFVNGSSYPCFYQRELVSWCNCLLQF